jgi:hypothetical protein
MMVWLPFGGHTIVIPTVDMSSSRQRSPFKDHIEQWRGFLRRHQQVPPIDVATLEMPLREELAALIRDAIVAFAPAVPPWC